VLDVKRDMISNIAQKSGTKEVEEPEKALVQRASKGDRDAYRILVEKYQNRVYSLIVSMVKSKEDAEDITQEAFVKAYLSLKNFRGDSSFYTWIYRVAYNMTIDFKRRSSKRSEFLATGPRSEDGSEAPPLDGVATDGNPLEEVERRELAGSLEKAMAQLTEEHRAVIMLREVDGLSYSEIADVVGVSQGTVMSRIHYAKKYLQQALKEFA